MSTQPEPAQPVTEAGRKLAEWLTLMRDRKFAGIPLPSEVKLIEAQATAAARAEPGTAPDDAHVRTPEGPDDYCTGCGELWPCSFQRGLAAARAEVARQVRELPVSGKYGPFSEDARTVSLAAVLALLEDAAPRQPEPGAPQEDIRVCAKRLAEYLEHRVGCPALRNISKPDECVCGLNALLDRPIPAATEAERE